MQKRPVFLPVLFLALAIVGSALAHSGATGVVKDRMDAMGEIAQATKTIANMVRGKQAFDPDLSKSSAKIIQSHAAEMLRLFPEGSMTEPSEALVTIWTRWDRFSQLAIEMEISAEALAANASSVEAVKPHFARMAKTCSTCHESFRLKK